MEKVDVRGPDECWPWLGSTFGKRGGYGQFMNTRTRVPMKAHRVAWMLTRGVVPDDVDVLHHCDNPPCCNPAHLFLGDDQSNTRDKMFKGRAAKKLTEAQVRDIRALLGEGHLTKTEIARRFGVSRPMVCYIASGKNWSWLA